MFITHTHTHFPSFSNKVLFFFFFLPFVSAFDLFASFLIFFFFSYFSYLVFLCQHLGKDELIMAIFRFIFTTTIFHRHKQDNTNSDKSLKLVPRIGVFTSCLTSSPPPQTPTLKNPPQPQLWWADFWFDLICFLFFLST